eukprot:gene4242-4949_t
MDEVSRWWASVPPVTKVLFAGMGLLTIGANFGLVSFYTLFLDYGLIFKNFEIWRIVTPVFFMGKLGFSFLMQMMFLLNHSTYLERGNFAGRTADYIYMVLVSSLLLLFIAYFLSFSIVSHGLIMTIIYVWSRMNPTGEVSFFFGLKFKAIYLPWVMMLFTILMGGLPILDFADSKMAELDMEYQLQQEQQLADQMFQMQSNNTDGVKEEHLAERVPKFICVEVIRWVI